MLRTTRTRATYRLFQLDRLAVLRGTDYVHSRIMGPEDSDSSPRSDGQSSEERYYGVPGHQEDPYVFDHEDDYYEDPRHWEV